MKLDKFKIVGQDDKTYKIAHPSGKEITVDKAGLSKEAHKHIQMLADGGEVEDESSPTDEKIVQDIASAPVDPALADQASGQNFLDQASNTLRGLSPGDPGFSSNGGQTTDDQAAAPATGGPSPASVEQPIPATPQAPVQPNILAQSGSQQGALLDQEANQVQNYQKQLAGANAPVGSSIDAAQKQLADLQQQQVQREAEFKAKDDEYQKQVAAKNIDPNRVYKNMDTGSRIQAGIAMILGGFGSAFTGKNVAIDMMDNAVNKDIEAQKNDQEKSMNLWKMNRQAYGDDMQANLATRNQILSGVQLQVKKAASSANTIDGQMRMTQLLNQIQQEKIQNNRQQALLSAPSANQAGQPAGTANLIQADPLKLVANMVPAAHQKDAIKEISDAQHVAQNKTQMDQLWDQATKENTTLRTGAGLLRTPGSIKSLSLLGDPLIHDQDGRVNEFEKKDFENTLPQPGDAADTLKTKRAAFDAFMTKKASAPTAMAFGLDPSKFANTAIVNKPQTKTVNGKVYVRGN